MRKLLIDRITYHVNRNGGLAKSGWRFATVRAHIYELSGKDFNTKQGRKEAASIELTPEIFEKCSDEQLVELFELVIICSYKQG